MKAIIELIRSWSACSSEEELQSIINWVAEKNSRLNASIKKTCLSASDSWYYDEEIGEIRNKTRSFFQICGFRQFYDGKLSIEQPIYIQNEIGYLGIICKKINGVLHMLMQAKIEPGNVNKIQISPTIQATISNFTQMHGGRKPAYLDYFLKARSENIIFDQIQSEQASRFLGKRNRNTMIIVDDDIEVLPSHRWMTLGTIKQLMKINNLVNMDTRTVLACIPFSVSNITDEEKASIEALFSDKALYHSMFDEEDHQDFVNVYHRINNYKMFHSNYNKIVPLKQMTSWSFRDDMIVHNSGYSFKVIFCDIEIEGREVRRWSQPLFEAVGMATFGLITADFGNKKKFLVQIKHEPGCFDGIELAPTVQLEASVPESGYTEIDRLFFSMLKDGADKKADVILSEEGGRFYCEQNKNIILCVDSNAIPKLPDGYFWLDYKTLNKMVQVNNILNIQLRNLLSLIDL